MLELDHFFILTDVNAPKADRLVEFGLQEGTPNIHPGQGTANRRFFFTNGMLEFLWVHSLTEAQSDCTAPTQLADRWQQRKTRSPFGLLFRPAIEKPSIPFKTWAYYPDYLPKNVAIYVGENSDRLDEPAVFYLPFARPQSKIRQTQPLEHPIGFREISSVCIYLPSLATRSPTLQAVEKIEGIKLKQSDRYCLEVYFDREKQGKFKDFQPDLPLTFCW